MWELEKNLKNAKDKIKAYQRKLSQAIKKKDGLKNKLVKGNLKAVKDFTTGI